MSDCESFDYNNKNDIVIKSLDDEMEEEFQSNNNNSYNYISNNICDSNLNIS